MHGEALEQTLVAAAVVMGHDYDGDVAMSGSCIYCCAYTSEVLCTVLVSYLDVVGVSVSWVHYPCNVYSLRAQFKCFPLLGFETESSLVYFFVYWYELILFIRHVHFVNNRCQSFTIRYSITNFT